MSTKRLQRPSVTVNIAGSRNQIENEDHRVLFVGELAGGTAVAGELVTDVTKGEALALFGATSALTHALEKFFLINQTNYVDVIPTVEGDSKASATLTIAGVANRDTKLQVDIGGFLAIIDVTKGNTANEVCAKIINAFLPNTLLLVSIVGGTVVKFEHNQKTSSFNGNTIRVKEELRTSLTYASTVFGGGASTALAPTALTSMNLDERYQSIVYDYVLGVTALKNFTEPRVNLNNVILDGIGFTTRNATLDMAKAELPNFNFRTLVIWYNLDEMRYQLNPLSQTAEIVAIRALRLTQDTNIKDYTIDGVESFGSMNKCTLPYFNTPLNITKPTGRIIEEDLIKINDLGGNVIVHNCSTVLSEVLTTYKADAGGNVDVSWKYLNYIDTMLTIREFFVNNIRAKYAQTRLTDGDLIEGISITNKGAIKTFIVGLYGILADKGSSYQVGITRGGVEYNKYFKENLFIEDDLRTGKVTFQAMTPIVVQLRDIRGTIIEVLDLKFTL